MAGSRAFTGEVLAGNCALTEEVLADIAALLVNRPDGRICIDGIWADDAARPDREVLCLNAVERCLCGELTC